VTPEGAAKKSICSYLDTRRDVKFWVQESQGTYDAKAGRFRRKNSRYQRNGASDILIQFTIQELPILVCLEVKSKVGRQSDSQIEFQDYIEQGQGLYYIVRTIGDTQAALSHARSTVLTRLKLTT